MGSAAYKTDLNSHSPAMGPTDLGWNTEYQGPMDGQWQLRGELYPFFLCDV